MVFRLVGVEDSKAPQLTIDPYVPLTVQWPRYSSELERPNSEVLANETVTVEIKTSALDGCLLEFILLDWHAKKDPSGELAGMAFEKGVPFLSNDPQVDGILNVEPYVNGVTIRLLGEASARRIGSHAAMLDVSASGELVALHVKFDDDESRSFYDQD
ncbi:hypothetical protein [Streptomyces sp. NBC_01304]|uniref:hypothetical protein n=1 Tax=Streptomyces sp. NBC_01304 TaxID=2903818 RepID=UPI002E0F59D5|nr:hypothetical protein OG430_00110 [Streptomyces sp. NBC_01304]WSJ90875.1 hypothetical protein OG430_47400 [Streptomyces sp. NBC_01304]